MSLRLGWMLQFSFKGQMIKFLKKWCATFEITKGMCVKHKTHKKRWRNTTNRNAGWSSWFPLVSVKQEVTLQEAASESTRCFASGAPTMAARTFRWLNPGPQEPLPPPQLVPLWLFPIRGRSFMCVSLKLGSQWWFYWRRGWAVAASSHCSRLQRGLRANSLQMWALLGRWVRMSLIGHDFSFCVGILVRACN